MLNYRFQLNLALVNRLIKAAERPYLVLIMSSFALKIAVEFVKAANSFKSIKSLTALS